MQRNRQLLISGLLSIFFAASAAADTSSPTFLFPVNCQIGKNCFVLLQNDTKMIDIVLNTQQQMQQGVNVLAAAAGQVVKINNEPDSETDTTPSCGDEVIIQHANDWLSHYCHLKTGSVTVATGDMVKAGQVIGQVGQSGHANAPALNFTLLASGLPIDPFAANVWNPAITYQPYGLIDAGLSSQPMTLALASDHPTKQNSFTSKDPQVVAWARMYGVNKGDMQRFTFYLPSGKMYAAPQTTTISDNYAQWFATASFSAGANLPPQYFGTWTMTYEFKRGSDAWKVLSKQTFTLD